MKNISEIKRKKADRAKKREVKRKALGHPSPLERKRNRTTRRRGHQKSKYLAWVRQRPCCVPMCTSPYASVHAHHAVHKSQGGGDETAIPLCASHHAEYHSNLGSVAAAKVEWGVDFVASSDALYNYYLTIRKPMSE